MNTELPDLWPEKGHLNLDQYNFIRVCGLHLYKGSFPDYINMQKMLRDLNQ